MDQAANLTVQQQTPAPAPLPGQTTSYLSQSQQPQQKRKQVKNACTNCQKACKKCEDVRPCVRCVKYGISETCVSSVRKERRKGVRRGPYRRKGQQDNDEGHTTTNAPDSQATTTATTTPTSDGQHGVTYAPIIGHNGLPDYGYPANLHQYNFGALYEPDKLPPSGFYSMGPPMYPYQMVLDQVKGNQPPYSYPPHMMIPPYPSHDKEQAPSSQLATLEHDTKDDSKDTAKTQPMTPVPSSSSSSLTTSSPASNEEDDPNKFARLTELCSAALDQGGVSTTTSD
ncbi:hypothetical protein BC941DRAFT_466831 [Chlamydoabsidia padenii]|nr:hypothetical protein BC941DRAFT_466831 [Chlamydoabsidia padenii]